MSPQQGVCLDEEGTRFSIIRRWCCSFKPVSLRCVFVLWVRVKLGLGQRRLWLTFKFCRLGLLLWRRVFYIAKLQVRHPGLDLLGSPTPRACSAYLPALVEGHGEVVVVVDDGVCGAVHQMHWQVLLRPFHIKGPITLCSNCTIKHSIPHRAKYMAVWLTHHPALVHAVVHPHDGAVQGPCGVVLWVKHAVICYQVESKLSTMSSKTYLHRVLLHPVAVGDGPLVQPMQLVHLLGVIIKYFIVLYERTQCNFSRYKISRTSSILESQDCPYKPRYQSQAFFYHFVCLVCLGNSHPHVYHALSLHFYSEICSLKLHQPS